MGVADPPSLNTKTPQNPDHNPQYISTHSDNLMKFTLKHPQKKIQAMNSIPGEVYIDPDLESGQTPWLRCRPEPEAIDTTRYKFVDLSTGDIFEIRDWAELVHLPDAHLSLQKGE